MYDFFPESALSGLTRTPADRLHDAADAATEVEERLIDQSAIKGEEGTGFEKRANKGPFECGNCEYFDSINGACEQSDMMKKSKQPRLSDGRPSVAWDDCCEFLSRQK
jgi:hypothetical protein